MNDESERHPLWNRVDALLPLVNVPGRYAGGEFNAVRKAHRGLCLRHGLVHPDLYEAGLGDDELHRLYYLLNRHPDVAAERVFLPDDDLWSALESAGLPLFSLESRTPLAELDVVHFCLPRPRFFVNLPAMLALGGVPPRAADRGPGHPLVLASGPATLAPEAVADLVDLVLVGETEDAIEAFVERWRSLARARVHRTEAVLELARSLDGAYAPASYRAGARPPGLPDPVVAARVSDFEHAPVNPRPLVAGVRVLDDGMRIEIVRGAGPGRPPLDLDQGWPTPLAPPRPRSTARVLELAEAQYVATGHEDITLGAPHPHDHPDLAGLVAGLRARFRGLGLGLRIPGLPLADQVELLDPARDPRPGPSGTSPHAQVWPLECCPALRRLAGLDAENEAIVEAGRQAFRRGFASIELCVLLGVPGESDADRVAIGALARALSSVAAGGSGGGGKVELKCSLWIPRPHTACAGDAVADPNAFAAAVQAVRNGLGRRRDVRVRADSPDGAVLDAVLGRADRNLGAGLLAAARAGWRVRTAPGRVPEGESVAARILEAAGLDPAAALGPAAAPGPWARVHLADEPPGRES